MFGKWQHTGNLITSPDKRFDTTQLGGTFYDTYANAVSLTAGHHITFVSLVVDASWATGGSQILWFRNIQVNKENLNQDGQVNT